MATNFLKNASFYSSASFYNVLASLVSFPILTRLFDVGEYGVLGLVTATIPLIVGVGKFGLQHATIRFYAEVKAGKTEWTTEQYYSTLFLSLLASSLFIFSIWHLIVRGLGELIFEDPLIRSVFLLSIYIIVARIIESAMLNVLRAREEAFEYSVYNIIKRTIVLVSTLLVLFFYKADLVPYFITLGVVELIMVLVFVWHHIPLEMIRLRFYNSKLVMAMMMFGVPMFGMEFGGALMNVADRYIISAYLGVDNLGVYASAYTLVEYGQGVITTALAASAVPVFLRLHGKEGLAAAQKFISEVLRLYIWAAVLVVFMIASVGAPVLSFLSGEKYASGAVIMPWVAVGIGIFGAFEIVGAGLYLSKNTLKMLYIIGATAVANIGLNLVAVPLFGIVGAAATTLICYAGCVIATYWFGRQYIKIDIPWSSLGKSVFSGLVMFFVLSWYHPEMALLEIIYKGFFGTLVYVILILILDGDIRSQFFGFLRERGILLP